MTGVQTCALPIFQQQKSDAKSCTVKTLPSTLFSKRAPAATQYSTFLIPSLTDIFSEKLTTRLFDAVIHDELLYEALLSIKPNIRELLILKYWGDLSDSEVGQAMSMSQQMVNYNKNKALRNLKKIIEEMRNR